MPKCMGGEGKSRQKDKNIIRLTHEEHVEAHRLLCEKYPDNFKLKVAYGYLSDNPVNPMWDPVWKAKHDAKVASQEVRDKISQSLSDYRKENGFSEEHKQKIKDSREKRLEDNKAQGLNYYGTKIRENGECGQNQQYATRSIKVKCYYEGKEYYFDSIREGAIWWYNTRPLKPGYPFNEAMYQRKIKQFLKGSQPTYKDVIIDYIKWEKVDD